MVSLRPQRIARGIALRAEVARHRGDAVFCPICGRGFDAFKNAPDVALGLCWRCGSHERHRAQWLLWQSRPELLAGIGSLLHFAPEWTLRRRLSRIGHLRYVTADLDQADVDLHLDLTALDLPDGSFEGVICSHVLEHVPDDAAAMRELCRITAPGGWCLVMVPLDLNRTATYEDPSISAPADRHAAFWRPDHVRLYAPDIEGRLSRAGFDCERIRPDDEFGSEHCRRCAIGPSEELWLCRPRHRLAEQNEPAAAR
ncbi:MAG TPA: class I SAM-dependent methyltransferase [Solirubrobacteraceae bacterium]|nr:class I SAM-dependent methyltransferase [Solirubrobacteraceae bacterium]